MSYLVKPSTTVNEAATVTASASEVSKSTPSAADELTTQTSSTGTDKNQQQHTVTIAGYVSKDDVTNAEILWALKCIMSHYSMNSCKDLKDIFQLMFADSTTAKKITLGSTKMSYYITYGLGPYFHNALLRTVVKCPKIVVCFDEAMNRVSQRGQMDVVLRFWNPETNMVCSRYFDSAFMGRASADCVLGSFKEALKEVPLGKLM